MAQSKSSEIFERALNRVPPETHVFVELSFRIFDRVHELLRKRGMTERDLAVALAMSEEDTSIMLSLGHNISLSKLAKLQTVLGGEIVQIVEAESREPEEMQVEHEFGESEAQVQYVAF
jgi:DNA-binding Xre family transcriptional regulator